MPNRSSNKPPEDDPNVLAKRIVDEATGEDEPTEDERRQAAKILGRRGGLKGGPARAKKLSKKRRSEIARKAAESRWSKKGGG